VLFWGTSNPHLPDCGVFYVHFQTLDYRELKTARGHMMSPPVHLFDICCIVFRIPATVAVASKKAMNERMNEDECVYLGC